MPHQVACVDDTPGALQSGQYLWPAAPALAEYMLMHWSELHLPDDWCVNIFVKAFHSISGACKALSIAPERRR
jgi:hypothetical protein